MNDTALRPLESLPPERFDTPTILKKLAQASRQLAELKGVAAAFPNQAILINTLGMQEAKDISAIENIVTTHDDIYQGDVFLHGPTDAAKEILRYPQALFAGFQQVERTGLLTANHIIDIQEA